MEFNRMNVRAFAAKVLGKEERELLMYSSRLKDGSYRIKAYKDTDFKATASQEKFLRSLQASANEAFGPLVKVSIAESSWSTPDLPTISGITFYLCNSVELAAVGNAKALEAAKKTDEALVAKRFEMQFPIRHQMRCGSRWVTIPRPAKLFRRRSSKLRNYFQFLGNKMISIQLFQATDYELQLAGKKAGLLLLSEKIQYVIEKDTPLTEKQRELLTQTLERFGYSWIMVDRFNRLTPEWRIQHGAYAPVHPEIGQKASPRIADRMVQIREGKISLVRFNKLFVESEQVLCTCKEQVSLVVRRSAVNDGWVALPVKSSVQPSSVYATSAEECFALAVATYWY